MTTPRPTSPTDAIAAILARGVVRMNWRSRRDCAESGEKLSVNGENGLEQCDVSGPAVAPAVDTAAATPNTGATA